MNDKITDEQVVGTKNHLEMMRRSHLWPKTSVLPLHKADYLTSHDLSKGGLLIDLCPPGQKWGGGDRYVFWQGANLLIGIPASAESREGNDDLLVQLVNEGWLVD